MLQKISSGAMREQWMLLETGIFSSKGGVCNWRSSNTTNVTIRMNIFAQDTNIIIKDECMHLGHPLVLLSQRWSWSWTRRRLWQCRMINDHDDHYGGRGSETMNIWVRHKLWQCRSIMMMETSEMDDDHNGRKWSWTVFLSYKYFPWLDCNNIFRFHIIIL